LSQPSLTVLAYVGGSTRTLGLKTNILSMRSISILVVAAALSSCSAPPTLTGPTFVAIEQPAVGLSRLYVFRPTFTEQLVHEAPWIAINNNEVVQLAHGGFASVTLRPGKYQVAVRPVAGQSDLWQASIELNAETGKTYFAAVWMDQTGMPASGMLFVPVAGVVLPIPTRSSHTIQRASAARLELVSEQQATPELQELKYLPSKPVEAPR
jgi:hypothetical protein